MAQVYKALKDFEINGNTVIAGEEIVLTARDGEKYTKEKSVVLSDRELDLNDPKDIALNVAANERKEKKVKEHADADTKRQKEVDTREAERDEVRLKKIEKVQELYTQKYGEPAPVFYESMTEDEADAAAQNLEALLDYIAPEENNSGNKPNGVASEKNNRTV